MQTHSFVDCYLFIKPKDNKWILKQENLLVTLKENAVLKGPVFCPTVINTEAILQTNVTCCLWTALPAFHKHAVPAADHHRNLNLWCTKIGML